MVSGERPSSLETRIAIVEQRCDYNEQMLKDIHEAVCGNGQKGLRREMDEVNIKLRFLFYVASAAFVGVLGLVGKLVYAALTGL